MSDFEYSSIIWLTKGKYTIIDNDDYVLLMQRKWNCSHYGYAVNNKYSRVKGVSVHLFLHRLLMNPPSNMVIDHINHDTLDNRRSNLRLCTRKQNQGNQRIRKNNTSGYKGVHLNARGKFVATIGSNGKKQVLGSFKDIEDAAKAYDIAAIIQWGEFAKTNFEKFKDARP